MSLFDSLGRYDLEGSVQALDLALSRLREEVKSAAKQRGSTVQDVSDARRLYGLAAAVILI